jgi:hypothetical protein
VVLVDPLQQLGFGAEEHAVLAREAVDKRLHRGDVFACGPPETSRGQWRQLHGARRGAASDDRLRRSDRRGGSAGPRVRGTRRGTREIDVEPLH